MTTTKLDLKKTYPDYFRASKKPSVVDLPSATFISYSGQGAPESDAFADAIGALYSLAYTLKFTCKAEGQDFVVSTLEAFWWVDSGEDLAVDPSGIRDIPRDEWTWKAMIRLPDFVTSEMFTAAQKQVHESKGIEAVFSAKMELIEEGLCVQAMHVGPYSTEPETVQKMLEFMASRSLVHAARANTGPHHEIYLSDPRRTAPEKLKTIIRIPVEKTAD